MTRTVDQCWCVGRDLHCAGAEATSSAVETPNHVLLEFLVRTLGSVGHGMLAGLRRVEAHRSGARRGTDLQKQVYGMSEVRDLWKDRPKQQSSVPVLQIDVSALSRSLLRQDV